MLQRDAAARSIKKEQTWSEVNNLSLIAMFSDMFPTFRVHPEKESFTARHRSYRGSQPFVQPSKKELVCFFSGFARTLKYIFHNKTIIFTFKLFCYQTIQSTYRKPSSATIAWYCALSEGGFPAAVCSRFTPDSFVWTLLEE